MQSGVYIEERKYRYTFADINVIEVEGERFVYGLLVKYKRLLEGELVDEIANRIIEGGLEYGIKAKSSFFLHFYSSIITYRPIPGKITDAMFRRIFCRLLVEGHQGLFIGAKIDPINEKLTILDAVDTFQRIISLKLDLRPTNPSNRDEYRSIDERIKRLRAENLKEEIQGGESGLDKQALRQDEAYKGILMAEDGYGSATVNGISENGRNVTISTEDSPVTIKAISSESPIEILESLLAPFRRILRRDHNANEDET